MTTETTLRRALQRVAADLSDDDPRLEQVIRRGRNRRLRHRGAAGATVAGLVVALTLTVSLDLPASTPLGRQALTDRTDVVIHLCGDAPVDTGAGRACDAPVTDAQLGRLRAALALDEAVAGVRHETQQQAYERFSELFADQPDLVGSVTPDALPASLRITLVDDADIDTILSHYAGFGGVEAVVAPDAH